MKRPLCSTLLIFVGFCLLLSGCTGFFQQQKAAEEYGSVVGQVIDPAGDGVPNVRVIVEGTDIAGVTDDQGHFSFPHVPVGPQRIAVENPPQVSPLQMQDLSTATLQLGGDDQSVLMLNDKPIPWATLFDAPEPVTTLDVVVKANETQQLRIRIPVYDGLDSVTLVSANPRLGQTLQGDAPPEFTFDVAYSLQSTQHGRVRLYLIAEQPSGETEVLRELTAFATRGASIVRFSSKLPDEIVAPNVRLVVILHDQSGYILAINALAGYPVEGGSMPYAPTLELAEINAGQLVFTWSGGNPVDFVTYELLRGSPGSSIYFRSLIATTSDPDASFLVDDAPLEGTAADYQLRMRTQNHGDALSNILTVETPNIGVQNIFSAALIGDIVLDPVRDILYVTDVERNEIVLISTDTYTVLKRIPVGSRPMRMAITADGTTLFATNTGSESISVIDLITGSVSFMEGIRAPYGIAVDSARDRLFYTSGFHDTTLRATTLSSGELIAEAKTTTGIHLALSSDGSRLLVTPDNSYFNTFLFDTEDLSELSRGQTYLPDFHTAQFSISRGEVYIRDRIYDASDLSYLDRIDYIIESLGSKDLNIQAISADEQHLYVVHHRGSGSPPIFYTLEEIGDRWTITLRTPLGNQRYALRTRLAHDESKAYVLTQGSQNMNVMAVDLELRRALAPSP